MDNDVRLARRPRKSVLQTSLDASTDNKQQEPDDTYSFRTPDEVAAEQTLQKAPETTQQPNTEQIAPKTTGPGWRQKLALHWPPGKKEWLVLGVIVLLLSGLAAALVFLHSPKPVPVKKAKAIPVIIKPTIVPSTLSGLPVDPSVNKRPVTGVMIENSDQARPQAGLGQASVVFEAIAEGGVTRFLALYQDTEPGNIGPIRSARPYYEQWALGFDAGYAHVGGSPDALANMKAWGIRDLDEFYNAGSYHRISTRAAPHNVYTSIATLIQLEASKGYTSSTFTGFVRKKEAPVKKPTASTINLTLSGPDYNASYSYVAATNSYNRSEGGAPQTDTNTNAQISPKVVIAMVTPESNGALDSSGAYYSNYTVTGNGPVYIFQDGTVTTGQWTKSSNVSQIAFTDAQGQTIKLNPGQTWLTAVRTVSDITYTP